MLEHPQDQSEEKENCTSADFTCPVGLAPKVIMFSLLNI